MSRDVLRGPAGNNDRRVYVGNLPPDVKDREIRDIFDRYGEILDVDLKERRRDSYFGRGGGGMPFAFVEFQDRLAAEDAVEFRDGYNYDGYRLRVEFPRREGGRGGFRNFERGGGGRGRGPPRRSSYKIRVEGLPPTGSWQDLKDHMREAGEVCYADVDKNGGGIVEFVHRDDMQYALKNLDDTKFKSHENETSYITLTKGSRSYSRSRSRSPARRRRSYTRSRSRDRD